MPNEWLASGLRELGVASGDVVLVHTSMKGLGHVDVGASAVIDSLLQAVGADGTVLFPTLTGSAADSVGHPPAIDLVSTPCASWVGVVPEVARQRADAIRSVHPTHSVVALGANREAWTAGHELGNSPCDAASPYHRLMEHGGKILLLGGVTHDSNTSMHCLEEIANVPYHLQDEVAVGTVRISDGSVVEVPNRLHLWRNRYSHKNLTRDFTVVNQPLLQAGVQRSAPIGESMSTLIDAGGMRDVLMPLLMDDPIFLLAQQ